MFRELRKSKQQLSPDECDEVLTSSMRGVLSLVGDDGYPYGVPMNYVYLNGKIYFHSAREGHKIDALGACDKACFTVLSNRGRNEGEWWFTFHSVMVFGRVGKVVDEALRVEALTALGLKYFPTEEEVYRSVERSGQRVEMLELHPEHISGKEVREK